MWDNVTVLQEHTSGTPHQVFFGTPCGVQYTWLTSTAIQWAVDLFQLYFPSWPKHLVTPLTADSPHCQKRSS